MLIRTLLVTAFASVPSVYAQTSESVTSDAPAPAASAASTTSTAASTNNEPAVEQGCPSGNLLEGAQLQTKGVRGSLDVLKLSELPQEGSLWKESAVILETPASRLEIDLRAPRALEALVLQGDNNDLYTIEASVDGKAFQQLWVARDVEDQGLQTRSTKLARPVTARYLRISGSEGDGAYSVSRFRAYCQTPAVWPPQLKLPPPKTGWDAIDNPMMVDIKAGLAIAGTALLLVGYWLRRRGQDQRFKKTRDVGLATLGVFALVSWWNLFHFHFDGYIHIWEHYHYYVGAKYPELRYSRIYDCTAVADIEDGLLEKVKGRQIRDLATTNEIESSARIINDPSICKSHFSPERWEAFRKDIRFFRGHFSDSRWGESQHDHGYNGTPVWAILGRALATATEATDDGIMQLGLIDSGLLLGMWGTVIWAFGWRTACVALLWWGANYPARYWWNGGSFLRFDWLVSLVAGVCLLKKNKMFAGGAALTYATLLRIFPGMVVAAVILQALIRIYRQRRLILSSSHRQFAAGCIVTLAVLIPLSGWATQGLDGWVDFAHNSAKHLDTPLTNNMGLKTVVAYDNGARAERAKSTVSEDPFSQWKEARRQTFHDRKLLYLALVGAFLVLLALAVEGRPVWVAAALGTGLIPIATELTCYYYGFLLTYGLLWHRREKWREIPAIAVTGLAAVTCILSRIYGAYDVQFMWISLWTIVTIVAVNAYVAYDGHRQTWAPTLAKYLGALGIGEANETRAPKKKRKAPAPSHDQAESDAEISEALPEPKPRA